MSSQRSKKKVWYNRDSDNKWKKPEKDRAHWKGDRETRGGDEMSERKVWDVIQIRDTKTEYRGEGRMPDTPIKEATRGTEVERSDGIGRALSGLSCSEERQEWDRGRGKWETFSKGNKKGNRASLTFTHTYSCTQTHTLIHVLNVQKNSWLSSGFNTVV